MNLGRSTPEEKEAKRLERERLRAEDAQRQADEAFWASPIGQAREAYTRGDEVFQTAMDVVQTQTFVIPMSRAGTTMQSGDPTVVLNAICAEGWELINGSFVFLEMGSESRDKFMRSGQQIAVSGTILGYYLFRRNPEKRTVVTTPSS